MDITGLFELMRSMVTSVSTAINAASDGNQFMAVAILGGLAYISRKIPSKLWYFTTDRLTFTHIVEWTPERYPSDPKSHEELLALHLEKNLISKTARFQRVKRLSVMQSKIVEVLPSGTTYCIRSKRLFKVSRKNASKDDTRSNLIIRSAIWDKGYVASLVTEFGNKSFQNSVYTISAAWRPEWTIVGPFTGPGIIAINNDIKKEIDELIDGFINNKQWYLDNGVPHILNLVYHGPPGTGKTSIAEYIAHRMDTSLFMLTKTRDPGDILGLSIAAKQQIAEDKYPVILIDDIDANFKGLNRKIDEEGNFEEDADTELSEEEQAKKERVNKNKKEDRDSALAPILALLQSPIAPRGCVNVITTNDLKALDKAIYRPSRVHHLCYVGDMNTESIASYVQQVYDMTLVTNDLCEIRACDLSEARSRYPHDVSAFMARINKKSNDNLIKKQLKEEQALASKDLESSQLVESTSNQNDRSNQTCQAGIQAEPSTTDAA